MPIHLEMPRTPITGLSSVIIVVFSSGVPRKRNTSQMKEQSKTSERELSDEEIANLSDGEFKALVIQMLTDLIELG